MRSRGEAGAGDTFTTRSFAPRRPLVGLAMLVTAGVLAGVAWPLPVSLAFCVAVLSIVLVAVLPRRWALYPLCLLVFVVSWIRTDLVVRNVSPARFDRVMAAHEEGLAVAGTVTGPPALRPKASAEEQTWVFPLRLDALNRVGSWQTVRGNVRCFFRAGAEGRVPRYGDRWILRGSLRGPDTETGRGARARDGRLVAQGEGSLLIRRDGGNLVMAWCLKGREACAAALGRGLEAFPTQHALLKALLLGYREGLPADLRNAFSVTGTLHMFAISGLHVGVVVSLLAGILSAVGIPRHRWVLFLLPALVAYTMATGLKPSAVRACVMALSFWFSAIVWRRPDGLSALALAAILMLFYAPLQLLGAGFILSFAVVTGLLVLTPPLHRVVTGWTAADPWSPGSPKGFARMARGAATFLLSLAAFSLVAWVVSFPLTSLFFNIFSPIAVLGNLLVVPGAYVVVLTGCLSILADPVSGFLAEVFNHANRVFIDVLLGFIDILARVPWGHRFVPSPHPVWIVAWYLLLGGWFLASGRRKSRRRMALITLAVGLLWWVGQAGPQPLEIGVLDADGGVIVHVQAGGREHMLINCGSAHQSRRLVRYLQSRGVNRLTALVLATGRNEDAGGAVKIMEAFPVDALWVCPGVGPGSTEQAVDEARRRSIPVRRLRRGDKGFLADGTGWEVLAPPARAAYADATRASLVMRIGRDGLAVTLAGGWDAMKGLELERAGVALHTPVMIWGERRVWAAREPDIERFGPEYVILSMKDFQTEADDYASLVRHFERGAAVVRTDDVEGILLSSTPGPVKPGKRSYEMIPLEMP